MSRQLHPPQTRFRYRFARFELDPEAGWLTRDGHPRRIQDKALRLLVLLLDHAGEVVSREMLIEALWPDTVVEFDRGLNTAMRKVRAALGEGAEDPGGLVVTVPRRGYRFTGRVERVPVCPEAGVGGQASEPARPGMSAPTPETAAVPASDPAMVRGAVVLPPRVRAAHPQLRPGPHPQLRPFPRLRRRPSRSSGAVGLLLLAMALLLPGDALAPRLSGDPAPAGSAAALQEQLAGLLRAHQPCTYCAEHFGETGRLYDCTWCLEKRASPPPGASATEH